jgi:hypothetical protein
MQRCPGLPDEFGPLDIAGEVEQEAKPQDGRIVRPRRSDAERQQGEQCELAATKSPDRNHQVSEKFKAAGPAPRGWSGADQKL